jgi:Domain of unknown function (DUF4177)
MTRYEYKVIDTGKHIEQQLNELGAQGWRVAGVTTKKQLLIAPPQAIILVRELQPASPAGEGRVLDDRSSDRVPVGAIDSVTGSLEP